MREIMFVSRERGFAFRAGRDLWRDALFSIDVSIGFLPGAAEGEVPWRRSWHWSTDQLPKVVFRQFRWHGRRLTLPIGVCAFGRYRILWGLS